MTKVQFDLFTADIEQSMQFWHTYVHMYLHSLAAEFACVR